MVGFGLKVWVVAVEPIDAAMGFEVRLVQNTPDTCPTHGPGAPLKQGVDQIGKTPAGGAAIVGGRFTRGHRHHIQTLGGGKSAGADLGAGHLAGPGGPVPHSDCANGQRYGGHTRAPWPPEDSTAGPRRRPSGSIDTARTGPVGWNGHARSMLSGAVHQQINSRGGHEERAWSTPFHQAQELYRT